MFRITVLAPPQDGLGEVRPRLSSRPTGRSTVMGTQSQRCPPGTGEAGGPLLLPSLSRVLLQRFCIRLTSCLHGWNQLDHRGFAHHRQRGNFVQNDDN